MTNNSEVYWEANGLSLHTKAWTVKSFGGKRWFGPGKRGDDLLIPFQPGRTHMRKMRESKVFNLDMVVAPLNPDGTRDPSKTRTQKAHENWLTIVNALDVDRTFELVKRWYALDGTIMTATATAELIEGNGPNSDDGRDFGFNLQLLLADPYFYAPWTADPIGVMQALGDAQTDRVTLVLPGPGRVTNNRDGNWIEYTGSGQVTVDCRAGTAKVGGQYVNGQINRNPKFPNWFTIYPGENNITGLAGSGIYYYPAYR